MAVRCGNCKKSHDSAIEVRSCYKETRKKAEATTKISKDIKGVTRTPGIIDYGHKSPTYSQKPKPSTKKRKTKRGQPKGPDDKPLTPSIPKKTPPRYSNDGRPTGIYYPPRDRPTFHDGQKCKWCDGPLGLCRCD